MSESEKMTQETAGPSAHGTDEAISSLLPLTRRVMVQATGAAAALGAAASSARAETPEMEAKFAAARAAGHFGPRKIKEMETVWVTMRDGVKLALRIILPEDAVSDPVPAIMTYIPYRRRDGTRIGDDHMYYFLASHGYAGVRPDIRGSGDSEGVLLDEYLQSEQSDGVEIIAWLAKQPWCTGKAGMIGLSWGGFSALQVAANRPPELKAIITAGFTVDRYTDDAHYLGGALVQDMFLWGSDFLTIQAFPPDPKIVGARWREMWKQRCDALEFSVANWIKHQTYDAFWKHGSVCEDYSAIECPVYAIGGWTDGYTNSVPKVMEYMKVPRKALIGPWGHAWPDQGAPGPDIDWLDEQLRWWDHWLKGKDTGIMDEPAYRAWLGDEATYVGMREMPGRWVAEETWPSPRITPRTWHLNNGTLGDVAEESVSLMLTPDHQTIGFTSGHWCPGGGGSGESVEVALDQQVDDGRSLVFDSEPLTERIEFLGFPEVEIDLMVDKPVALLSVRLDELRPGGTSRRMSYGVLNLTHRDGHENPQPLEPGKRYRIKMQLKNSGFAFKPGNRIRVAIAQACWYLVWPAPEPVTLTVFTGSSTLTLPVRPPRAEDAKLRPFGNPFEVPTSGVTVITPATPEAMTFDWDVGTSALTVTTGSNGGARRLDAVGTVRSGSWKEVFYIKDDDPTSAHVTEAQSSEFIRSDWHVRIETTIDMTATKTDYLLKGEVKTFDGGKPFFSKSWDRKIPRMLS